MPSTTMIPKFEGARIENFEILRKIVVNSRELSRKHRTPESRKFIFLIMLSRSNCKVINSYESTQCFQKFRYFLGYVKRISVIPLHKL